MKARSVVLTLLALAVVAVVLLIAVVAMSAGKGKVPEKTILEVNLEAEVVEYVPADPFAQLTMRDQTQLRDIVEALERAAGDERVAGLIATVGQGNMGMAQLQEVRQAILKSAAVLFTDQGDADTKIAQIARGAGVEKIDDHTLGNLRVV